MSGTSRAIAPSRSSEPSSSRLRYRALRLRAERPRLSPPSAVRPRPSTLRRRQRAAMEAPHGAGPPSAARLRAPVQPHSRAPPARSQRGPPHSAQVRRERRAGPGPGGCGADGPAAELVRSLPGVTKGFILERLWKRAAENRGWGEVVKAVLELCSNQDKGFFPSKKLFWILFPNTKRRGYKDRLLFSFL